MAYLYNYAGAPWKTQERVYEILTKLYTDKADGLCGNEDCGQMSAWYILSSLGFYPVCPGDEKYIIGTPVFEKAIIRTGGNNKFIVTANNLSDKNFYIQSVKLNGKVYQYSYIKHSDIMKGGTLVFEMGSKPSKWGSDPSSRPISFIDVPFVPVPYLTSGERVFRDSVAVKLSSVDDLAEIFYTTDGTDPITGKKIYTNPIIINSTTILKTVSYKNHKYSKVVTARFNKIPKERSLKLNSQYHSNYTGGGALGLIDGIRGTSNFHTDAWQGYEGVDLDAVVDLGSVQELSLISASFLQNTRSWIFYPTLIEYFISIDGINFKKVYENQNSADETNSGPGIKSFDHVINGVGARYVKVFAKNIGVCPPWHIAAGGKTWLFIDEITIK